MNQRQWGYTWLIYTIILIILFNVVNCIDTKLKLNATVDELLARQMYVSIDSIGAVGVIEKKPYIAGIRLESLETGHQTDSNAVLGYTLSGVSVVQPNRLVRLVLFGYWLEELHQFAFTSATGNCSNAILSFTDVDFIQQVERRVVVTTMFPNSNDSSSYYRLCIKQKSRDIITEQQFIQIEDPHTGVTTQTPIRYYYMPMAVQISVIFFLLVLSGLFSGLTLGLMALSPQELELIQRSGSTKERQYAETILPVRRTGNLLLCSLLIGNVCVNSAVSILFDDLTSGYVALIVSSLGIVIFGEILPQSFCVKKGLAVGARTIWITRFFIVLTFPLAWPISRILDYMLGHEVVFYDRKRLMELIKMSTRNQDGLVDEFKIAVGAMEIADKTVKDVMTRIDDVFMLPDTTVLNTKTVAEILRMGYTRIPVYSGNRNVIVGLLFVKDLALLDPDDNFTIKTVCGYHEHPLRFVMEYAPLRAMLEEFKKGDYHLAMVQRIVEPKDGDPYYELTGIVTLEDIVEEILQAEIVDETDAVIDNVHRTRRRDGQAKDITRMLENEGLNTAISVQMQLVTIQWLSANQPAFHPDLISQNVLERLIKQHVSLVEFSHLPDIGDPKAAMPRTAKLYTKQEPSDRFILILEGRVMVTIGQNQMQFEAGPWHCFGEELLTKMMELAPVLTQQQQQTPMPLSSSRQSLNTPTTTDTGSELRKRPSVVATFIPDFTAVVKDDCTYLEITANTYLSAYRATLMQKRTRLCICKRDDLIHSRSRTSLA